MIVDLNNKENNEKNQKKDNELENNTEKTIVGDGDNNDNDDDQSGPSFEVLFPYDRIYPEQYRFLKCIKRALFKKGHALIEAPPGTNQSLCLLSLLTSYQQQGQEQQQEQQQQQQQQQHNKQALDANHNHNKNANINSQRKIVYATNSVPETIKVARELAVIMDYRQQQHQQSSNSDNNGFISSSKRPQQHQVLFQNIEDGFWKSTNGVAAIDESALIQDYNQNYANRSDSLRFFALCLKGSDRDIIDDACRTECNPTRVDSDVKQQNPPPLNGIFTSLEQLHTWAALNVSSLGKYWASPQQLTKYAILHANVLVVTYPFLLDPMTAMIIGSAIFDSPQQQQTSSKENNTTTNDAAQTKMQTEDAEKGKDQEKSASSQPSSSDAVIVFDHAHNIDAACMDALSATVNLLDLEQATRSLDKISSEITRFKQHQHSHHTSDTRMAEESSDSNMKTNNSRNNLPLPLKDEYDNLVQQPIDRGMYRPILFPSDDVVKEPVPGNIRHMKHFIGCMKKIVEHFKNRLRLATEVKQQQSSRSDNGGHKSKKKKMGTGSVSPLAFLHQMMNATALDSKTLRFVHSRVLSMLRTLNLSKDHFVGLINVAYLASLLGFTNTLESSKFAIVLEQTSVVIGHHRQGGNSFNANAMMLQVACLDPSLAIRPIFERFNTVILTSSTLSPLSFYPKILQFKPVVAESIPMTTIRPCVIPMMISRGSDQLGISTSYKERFTMGCIRNYGKMLVDLVSSIPDGIVVYFPSYNYMEALICEWDATGIMREMTEWKLIFVETKDNLELNAIALDNYRASCDIGRGGVFFSVARGNISEAVPFDLHYGRASVMIGIPYEYTLSKVVQARLEYIQTQFDIREQDYLTFDAVRQVAKCFGRVIRSKTDYGVLIFADNRFHRNDKRSKLPGWITQFLTDSQQDLTTDSAVAQIKTFLRQTGQPVDQNLLQDVLANN